MNRRLWSLAAVAAAAGAAASLWRQRMDKQRADLSGPSKPAVTASGPAAEEVGDFWGYSVDRLDGTSLPLASLRGQRLLVNFWATWCPPCVREMPLIEQFHRQFGPSRGAQGWRVLGVAIDRKEAVAAFLQRQPVSYDIGLAGLEGTQWSRDLGNLSGGLPFTVAFDAQGRVLQRRLGEVNAEMLKAWAHTGT